MELLLLLNRKLLFNKLSLYYTWQEGEEKKIS